MIDKDIQLQLALEQVKNANLRIAALISKSETLRLKRAEFIPDFDKVLADYQQDYRMACGNLENLLRLSSGISNSDIKQAIEAANGWQAHDIRNKGQSSDALDILIEAARLYIEIGDKKMMYDSIDIEVEVIAGKIIAMNAENDCLISRGLEGCNSYMAFLPLTDRLEVLAEQRKAQEAVCETASPEQNKRETFSEYHYQACRGKEL